MKNEAPIHLESYQQLISALRADPKVTPELKRFMINAIFDKVFPNRYRIKIRISDYPKVVIDSSSKRCFNCGEDAHYIVYNMINLPKFGWRLCWKHLDDRARKAIERYYETQM